MNRYYKDDFGNSAVIIEGFTLPYNGAASRTKSYILESSADYDDGFVYFRSVYETVEAAEEKLNSLSCGTWKKQMVCGGTGRPCPYSTKPDGSKPCEECETGRHFREGRVVRLHDE